MLEAKPYSVLKAVCAGGIGNIVEWYSFLVYAYLTPEIAQLFFPKQSKSEATILSLLIFAAGFLARPIGALIFGYIGDHHGRRLALLLSQYLMAVSTLLLCFLPTYASLGLTAALLLVILRIIQGLSIAGEYTTSLCYLVEISPAAERGLWVSTVPSSTALGILLSALVVFFFRGILSTDQLLTWGWRVCFFMGFILAVVGVYLRHQLPETALFLQSRQGVTPQTLRIFLRGTMLPSILFVVLLGTAYSYFYQALYIWLPTVLKTEEHTQGSFLVNLVALLVFLIAIIGGGRLSDQFGRRRTLLMIEILFVLMCFPLLYWLSRCPVFPVFLLVDIVFSIIFGLFVGSVSVMFAEIYPVPIRAFALSVSYNVTYAIVGGLTPAFLAVIDVHYSLVGAAYVSVIVCVIALLATCCLNPKAPE